MMIRQAPASDAVANERPKAMRLIFTGLAAIRRSAPWSWATAWMARPVKVRDRKSCRAPTMTMPATARQERHQKPPWQVDDPEVEVRPPDVPALHRTVVDAEDQDQRHFGDEQDAEEEGETAQRLVVAPLEGDVVDLIGRHTEQVEG